jgi:hypothetical protein
MGVIGLIAVACVIVCILVMKRRGASDRVAEGEASGDGTEPVKSGLQGAQDDVFERALRLFHVLRAGEVRPEVTQPPDQSDAGG